MGSSEEGRVMPTLSLFLQPRFVLRISLFPVFSLPPSPPFSLLVLSSFFFFDPSFSRLSPPFFVENSMAKRERGEGNKRKKTEERKKQKGGSEGQERGDGRREQTATQKT